MDVTRSPVSLVMFAAIAVLSSSGVSVAKDYRPYITATMDDGVGKNLFAFYEQGLDTAAPKTGLPHAGIVHAADDPASTFLFQPYANTNNVLLLNKTNLTGRLTLATPEPFESLALAASSSFGPANIGVRLHFADGGSDLVGQYSTPDWFTGGYPAVVITGGRVWAARGTFETLGHPWSAPVPYIFEDGLYAGELSAARPLAWIDLSWSGDFNPTSPLYPGPFTANTAFFGVSVSPTLDGPFVAAQLTPDSFNQDIVVEANPVPEPGSGIATIAAGLLLLLRRRVGR